MSSKPPLEPWMALPISLKARARQYLQLLSRKVHPQLLSQHRCPAPWTAEQAQSKLQNPPRILRWPWTPQAEIVKVLVQLPKVRLPVNCDIHCIMSSHSCWRPKLRALKNFDTVGDWARVNFNDGKDTQQGFYIRLSRVVRDQNDLKSFRTLISSLPETKELWVFLDSMNLR